MYAETQTDKPLVASLSHRLEFVSSKVGERRPEWSIYFLHGLFHGRVRGTTKGPLGIPFKTSSLYKDNSIRIQLDQAKQSQKKVVIQRQVLKRRLANSFVFRVVLTLDVLLDGEVELKISLSKPQLSDGKVKKLAQLQGAKKKRHKAMISWVTTHTSGNLSLSLSLTDFCYYLFRLFSEGRK